MRIAKKYLVLVFFVFLTVFIFRQFFFEGNVPFPANLLVSYYQPWKSNPPPEYPNGPPNKPMGFDNLRIHYPLKTVAISIIKDGRLPLWNPHNFSGNTLFATYQIGVLHPLSFLYLVLPQIDAWSFIVVLQPFLALLFTYLFLKKIGQKSLPAIFGSFTYALSLTVMVWWEEVYVAGYTAICFPLALFALESHLQKPTKISFVFLTIAFVFLVICGWFQFTLYGYLLIIAWLFYRLYIEKRYRARQLLQISSAWILSLFISAVHIVPGLEALVLSPRSTTDARFLFEQYLISPTHLITLLAPDFFGSSASYNYFGNGFYYEQAMYFGTTSAILIVYYAFVHGLKIKKNFLFFLFLIFLSLGLSLPTSWILLYHLHIPVLSVLIPSRIFLLSTFIAAIIAAFAFSNILQRIDKKALRSTAITIATVLLIAWIFVLVCKFFFPKTLYGTVSLRNLVIPSIVSTFTLGVLFVGGIKKFRKIMPLAILGLSLFTALYLTNKYLYFSEKRFVFPQHPVISKLKELSGLDRAWGYGAGIIENNFASQYGLYSPEGYDSFLIGRYGELVQAANSDGRLTREIPRADAKIQPKLESDFYKISLSQERFLSLTGVRYILGPSPQKEPIASVSGMRLTPVFENKTFTIYENLNSLPRVFFVDNVYVAKSDKDLLAQLFSPTTNLLRTAVVEDDIKVSSGEGKKSASIRIYKPGQIAVQANSQISSLLVLTDAYFPGWNVYVDGVKARSYRVNYSFRGVVVPEGNHEVVWKYEPLSFKIGAWLSIFGLFTLTGTTFYLFRKHKIS